VRLCRAAFVNGSSVQLWVLRGRSRGQLPRVALSQRPFNPFLQLCPEFLAAQEPAPPERFPFALVRLGPAPLFQPALKLRAARRRIAPNPVFAQRAVHPKPARIEDRQVACATWRAEKSGPHFVENVRSFLNGRQGNNLQ
jgi:hypothetical protein